MEALQGGTGAETRVQEWAFSSLEGVASLRAMEARAAARAASSSRGPAGLGVACLFTRAKRALKPHDNGGPKPRPGGGGAGVPPWRQPKADSSLVLSGRAPYVPAKQH